MNTIAAVLDGSAKWCVIHGDNAEVLLTSSPRSGLPWFADHVITDPPFTRRTSQNARTNRNQDSQSEAHAWRKTCGNSSW